MKKVFIVGVNHCWQQLPGWSIGKPSLEAPNIGLREITEAEFASFDGFMRDTIRQNGIRTIVEEACGRPHLRMSTLAAELNLQHKYCDLTQADRDSRGIKTPADREKHWLSVVASVEHYPALMICGATHVQSFRNLLRESKYEPLIVVTDYEQTLFP